MPLISVQSATVDRILRIVLIIVAVCVALVLVAGGWWLVKHHYDQGVITTYVTKSNAQADAQMGVANSAMAVEEKRDTAAIAVQRQELHDASNPPATVHDGLSDRQRRGCVILRQQGQDLGRIAACRSLAR